MALFADLFAWAAAQYIENDDKAPSIDVSVFSSESVWEFVDGRPTTLRLSAAGSGQLTYSPTTYWSPGLGLPRMPFPAHFSGSVDFVPDPGSPPQLLAVTLQIQLIAPRTNVLLPATSPYELQVMADIGTAQDVMLDLTTPDTGTEMGTLSAPAGTYVVTMSELPQAPGAPWKVAPPACPTIFDFAC